MPRPRPPFDLSPYLIEPALPYEEGPITWAALFGNAHPVELEIGSGRGLFLVNAATASPGHNFLGIELSRKYARLAAGRLARRCVPNAKVFRGDAGLVLARLIPSGSLRAIHVYFPDPWWKKRHKKRRVFTAPLVADAERTLEPGGSLNVASDVEEYFDVIRRLIEGSRQFREQPVRETALPAHDLDYLTSFERKYRIEGRTIYRARYALKPADGERAAQASAANPLSSTVASQS
jgi:tRNA (guanine-N7-)-methyltransferase